MKTTSTLFGILTIARGLRFFPISPRQPAHGLGSVRLPNQTPTALSFLIRKRTLWFAPFSRAAGVAVICALFNFEAPADATNCVPVPPGIVSWWKADGNALDAIGTNHGTLVGSATFGPGEVGQTFVLDGLADGISVGNPSSLQLQDFTIEAWIKRANASKASADPGAGDAEIFACTWGGYGFLLRDDGKLLFSKIGYNFIASTTAITDTELFHHVAVTKSGNAVVMYVDGVPESFSGYDSVFVFNGPSAIGARGTDYANSFLGQIDELAVYNRALSTEEVQAVYHAGGAGKCTQQQTQSFLTNGLVAYYPLNGNANDASGNGSNANLQGGQFFPDRFGRDNMCLSNATTLPAAVVPDFQNPAPNMTMSVWYFVRSAEDIPPLGNRILDHSWGLGSFAMGFMPGNPESIGCCASDQCVYRSGNVHFNTWQNLVSVVEGKEMRVFLDGDLIGTTQLSTDITSRTRALGIGSIDTRVQLKGLIDDIRIYDRALSADEVRQLYAHESIPPESFLTNGLVAYYPFSGNANDASGNGNNGTAANVTFATVGTRLAATFTGALNSSVTVPNSPSLAMTNAVTVSLWYYSFGNNGGPAGFLDKAWKQPVYGDWSYRSWFLYYSTGAGGTVNFQANGPALATGTGISPLNNNQWYHMVFIADGGRGLLQVYTNGVFGQENIFTPFALSTGPYPLVIGAPVAQTDGAQTGFNGAVNNVRIYDRTLSPVEVQQLYAYESALPPASCIPHAATAVATLVNGFVVGVVVNDGACGYTNTPLVRFIGGGGSGAQAVAEVSNGVVVNIISTDAGSGYTNAPLVVVDPPFISKPVLGITPMSFLSFTNLTVGGVYQLQRWSTWYWTNQPLSFTATNPLYTQMFAGVVSTGDYRLALNPVPSQAFATPEVINGFVVGATLTAGGSGYVTSPAVTIVGGGGTNATAVSHISGGVVTSISITDAGIGYTNTPTVRIAPPPAAALFPSVEPVMRVDSANLAPYENYQIQFTPFLGGPWTDWNGGLFYPTGVTNSQYLFITNDIGFFRMKHEP